MNSDDPIDAERYDYLRGTRTSYTWKIFDTYVYNPLLLQGDFLYWSRLVLSPTCGGVIDILSKFGELLPITIEGEAGYSVFLPRCIRSDVVDFENCIDKRNLPGQIGKFSFFVENLTEACIFEVPGRLFSQFLVTGVGKNSSDDFYLRYHELGLSGLKFKKIWEG